MMAFIQIYECDFISSFIHLLKTIGYCPDTKFTSGHFEAPRGGGWCEDELVGQWAEP